MTHHLSIAVAQSHQQDLRRDSEAAQMAAEARTNTRIGRIRFSLPQLQIGRRIAAVRATIASA